jgi:uncharacterized protein (DUF924 family)
MNSYDPFAAVLLTVGVSSIATAMMSRRTRTAVVVSRGGGHASDDVRTPEEVLDFWFRTDARDKWFAKDAGLDACIRDRFGATIRAALDGRLRDWEAEPRSSLALVVVLDQFTRNAFRGSPRSYSGDAEALRVAAATDVSGLTPHERWFAAMPFQHSERIENQTESLSRFEALALQNGGDFVDAKSWAVKHFDVIDRFGRFPHRNALLGRRSTRVEEAFLKEPGSSF